MTGEEDDRKELRVRIEASHHQKLVALKMLRHKTMSEAIHEALEHYFAAVLPVEPRLALPPHEPRLALSAHVAAPAPEQKPHDSEA